MPSTTPWRQLLVAGSAAMLTLACTGGDDGTEVIVDGGQTDPSAVVAEAGGRTEVASGRVRQSFEWDFSDWGGPSDAPGQADGDPAAGTMSAEFEGTFTGSSIDGDMGIRIDGSVEAERLDERFRLIEVDGVAFSDAPPGSLFMGELGGDVTVELRRAAGGRTWFESAQREPDTDANDRSTVFGLDTPNRALQVLGELDEVRELDPVAVDGTELTRFAGRASLGSFDRAAEAGVEDVDGSADLARQQRIEAYSEAHQWLEVEVHIDPDGYVRRLELRSRDEVEERYRDCMALIPIGGVVTSVEFWDLGASVDIVAPDPDDVMPYEEQQRVMADWFGSEQGGLLDIGPSDGDELSEDDAMPPGMRAFHEEELRAGAAEIDLDPASVASMTDDELLSAWERLWDLRDSESDGFDVDGFATDGVEADGFGPSEDDPFFEGCPE